MLPDVFEVHENVRVDLRSADGADGDVGEERGLYGGGGGGGGACDSGSCSVGASVGSCDTGASSL